MGKKITAVYIVFSILFFAVLVVLFSVRIQDVRKSNLSRISRSFESIRGSVETTYRRLESFEAPSFKEATRAVFEADPDLNVLVVYSYETGIEYLRARNADSLSNRISDLAAVKGIPQFTYNSFSQTKITSSITIPHKNSFIIEGVYRVLRERDLFPILRDTVLVLLAFSFFTTVLLIILKYCERAVLPAARNERTSGQEHSAEPDQNPLAETAASSPVVPPPSGAAVSNPAEPEAPAKEPSPAVKPEASRMANEPSSEEGDERSAKQGLFSPDSGLGWQEYLEKRLTLELERAAFNEQDLSLVIMKYRRLTKASEDYRAVAKEILDKMAFEDLAFEFNDGYAVIFPNSNLDQTIRTMSDFHRKIVERITLSYGKPQCGITSRNGRLVDGSRLILEASQALERTTPKDEDCIVGFRTDPGKYRKYLSDRGAKALS